jgi:hypothetical protein
MAEEKSPLSVDDVKTIMEDFDDFDTELENTLEQEFEAIYQDSLKAALVYIKRLENLSDTVTADDRRVVVLLNKATEAFNKMWTKRAGKLLSTELNFAIRRGIVQMRVFNQKIEENSSETKIG